MNHSRFCLRLSGGVGSGLAWSCSTSEKAEMRCYQPPSRSISCSQFKSALSAMSTISLNTHSSMGSDLWVARREEKRKMSTAQKKYPEACEASLSHLTFNKGLTQHGVQSTADFLVLQCQLFFFRKPPARVKGHIQRDRLGTRVIDLVNVGEHSASFPSFSSQVVLEQVWRRRHISSSYHHRNTPCRSYLDVEKIACEGLYQRSERIFVQAVALYTSQLTWVIQKTRDFPNTSASCNSRSPC